ncbi:MAG: SMC family ATPase [Actinomycetia bacterium]|nr:SMC family ATPase [Actinomycetes bacterium]MCP4845239.1 SMC family ATPase [Actinomycetes bacterium]
MITYLRLANFRRHADTELHFTEADRVVLLAGPNGAGKTSITEAVVYALYGEQRQGRRGLDSVVRRGAELEGAEVEMDFELGGHTYKVIRRRDNKASSALLYCDGDSIMESADGVTAEVTRLLGMDARGFRTATFAQQKELDGLATMPTPERRKMLSRLLRVDAVERARDAAGSQMRSERHVAERLADDGMVALAEQVEALEAAYAETLAERTDAAVIESDLGAELESTAWVDPAFESAQGRLEDAQREMEDAAGEVSHIEDEIATVVMPDEVEADVREVEELVSAREALKSQIADASNAERRRRQAERVVEQITEMQADLAGAQDAAGAAPQLALAARAFDEVKEATKHALAEARNERQELLQAHAAATARRDAASVACDAAGQVGAECTACGQEVSEDHRHGQVERTAAALSAIEDEVQAISTAGTQARSEEDELVVELGACEELASDATGALDEARTAARRIPNLVKNIAAAQESLASLASSATTPLPELEASLGRVEIDLSLARGAAEAAREREIAATAIASYTSQMERARKRLVAATERVAGAAVGSELVTKRDARVELRNDHVAAVAAREGADVAVSAANAEMAAAQARLEAASETARKRNEALKSAEVASVCQTVLENVARNLHTQIKPSIEGLVSEILATMSNGRFDSVRVDDKWNLFVRDDGQHRPLGELSGGEVDLVALAMRLALAAVVSERHGAGGTGFLVLDEPLGSLDDDRRASVLDSLRNLRGAPQVFIISHVGGIEETADMVVTVTRDEGDEALSSVEVS